jgi:hypothetical protein
MQLLRSPARDSNDLDQEPIQMPDKTGQIAEYLAGYAAFSSHVPRPGYPRGIHYFPSAPPMPSAERLAQDMVEDVGFQALRLGGFLRTPDGEVISRGVALALPNADRSIFNLAVEALTLAAEKQNNLTPLQIGAGVLSGVLVLAAIYGHNAPPAHGA